MFSATFPKQIQSMAKKILKKPIEILVGLKGQGLKIQNSMLKLLKKTKVL